MAAEDLHDKIGVRSKLFWAWQNAQTVKKRIQSWSFGLANNLG